jgi:DNA-binding LacI/PurR family transcriptional regulator
VYDPQLVRNVAREIEEAKYPVREWLLQSFPLDGLICTNANICYSVLRMLDEIGYERFENLKIFSFEENRWLGLLRFPLFALDQPIEAIGDTASKVLLARMAGDDQPPQDYFLECRIREHGTVRV